MSVSMEGPKGEPIRMSDQREAAAELAADDGQGAATDDAIEDDALDLGDGGESESASGGQQEPLEAVDFSGLAEDLLSGAAGGDASHGNARENAQKAQLIRLGFPEQAAHTMAFNSGTENAQRVIDALTGRVSSQVASPASQPEGSEQTGVRLPENEGGPEAQEPGNVLGRQMAAMEARFDTRLQALQKIFAKEKAGEMLESMNAARAELVGAYPELRSSAQVKSLEPHIRAAVTSGLAADGAEAVRIAVHKQFGVRSASSTSTGAEKKDDPVPSPGKVSKAGSNAATAAKLKKRLGKMIFDGRPKSEIEAVGKKLRSLSR